MDNQNQNPTQPSEPKIEGVQTPPPATQPVPTTTPPIAPTDPTTPPPPPTTINPSPIMPQNEGKKGKGLMIVAIILVILIISLGVLYYVIIQQSSNQPANTPVPQQVVVPTKAAPTPTVTPTDDQILESEPIDPTLEDGAMLEKETEGL